MGWWVSVTTVGQMPPLDTMMMFRLAVKVEKTNWKTLPCLI